MCSTLVLHHGFKNNKCYTCSSLVLHHGFKNNKCYTCSLLVSHHGFKNEECYCSALGLPHGLKTDEYVISVAHFCLMALRMTCISCAVRLFSLMAN